MKKKKKSFVECSSSILFLGVIFILSALAFFQSDEVMSESENRTLQMFPKMNALSFLDQSYQDQIMRYASDQFFQRTMWTQGKTRLEYLFGKRMFEDVYVGQDDQLFQQTTVISNEKIAALANRINDFVKRNQQLSIEFMLVPNKETIYKEKVPNAFPRVDQNAQIQHFVKQLSKDVHTIDVSDALRIQKDEDVYYHSDHHWTTKGAKVAFDVWKKRHPNENFKDTYDIETVHDQFIGSLSKKSGYIGSAVDKVKIYLHKDDRISYIVENPTTQEKKVSLYDLQKAESANPYDIFFGGNYAQLTITTSSLEDRHLLLFKDSYANCLIPFLLPYYHTITIIDPRYYYEDIQTLIKTKEVTDILFLYNANTFFSDTSLEAVLNKDA